MNESSELSNLISSGTNSLYSGTARAFAMAAITDDDGNEIAHSMLLTYLTVIPDFSASCSWVIFRCLRYVFTLLPNMATVLDFSLVMEKVWTLLAFFNTYC